MIGRPSVGHAVYLLPGRGSRHGHRSVVCRDSFRDRRGSLGHKSDGSAHQRLQVRRMRAFRSLTSVRAVHKKNILRPLAYSTPQFALSFVHTRKGFVFPTTHVF